MKKLVSVAVLFSLVLAFGSARAENCDQSFKGVEAYYCKVGEVEYQQGFEKTSRTACVEHKKIDITGCDIGPFRANDASTAYVYLVGTKEQRDKIGDFKFQCDASKLKHFGAAGVSSSGIWESRFEGYMHPNYTLDKFPGVSNSDRSDKFSTDLEKQGKVFIGLFSISSPSGSEYDLGDEVCQYYDVKTSNIAFRTTATFAAPGKGKAADLATGGSEKPDAKKGLKKLFGR